MTQWTLMAGVVLGSVLAMASAEESGPKESAEAKQEEEKPAMPPALNHTMESITGEPVDLATYHGKVVLMVNVASRCGHTKQYKDLQALNEKYRERGLEVLGFPCNQFKEQEPGTSEEIAEFCRANYGVTFDLFEKIEVNGENASPLYKYLTSEELPLEDKGPVGWNFEKFLLDREGNVIARFRSKVNPQSEEVVAAIEKALGPVSEAAPKEGEPAPAM